MYEGGYRLIKQPLVRASIHKHTAEDPEAISDEALRALNIIQATPWRVNRFVLAVMEEAWQNGDRVAGLPSPYDDPVPPRIEEDEWERMSGKERTAAKVRRMLVHEANAKAQGQRESLVRKLSIAKTMKDKGDLWFPHFFDFRTRAYPMAQDLNPQGDDATKSLLEFSEAVPLGRDGMYWLCVKIANCAGQDKLPFDERVEWVAEHHDDIVDSAFNPLNGRRYWCSDEIDEPWGFLATAYEYAQAQELRDPYSFPSRQPVPLDGATNGLQHLSLLGRDAVGATKTNCSNHPDRFDLYSEVASEVNRLISRDVMKGVAEANHWMVKGVDRKVVKRAVMTTPYGVTNHGIKVQLIDDGHVNGMGGEKAANAAYLRDQIVDALSTTVSSAAQLMAYFQTVAGALADHDTPFTWTTPTGCRITQSYYKLARKEVRTLAGRVVLWDEDKLIGLDKRKQMLAASPNVVHSLDASMLQRTVLTLHDRHGIKSFATIHDSYATHAAHTDLLSRVLREEAYVMYYADQLTMFHEHVARYAPPDCELPEPPEQGSFDPAQVLAAPYFFG